MNILFCYRFFIEYVDPTGNFSLATNEMGDSIMEEITNGFQMLKKKFDAKSKRK